MKIKLLSVILGIIMLSGCSQTAVEQTQEAEEKTAIEQIEEMDKTEQEQPEVQQTIQLPKGDETVDYDLTVMSETMVYAQIYDVLINPTNYDGITFKIHGEYEYYTIPDSDEIIYFIVINDALGCCPQGLEIRFTDDVPAPENFAEVIMKGTAYSEFYEGYTYIHFVVTEFEEI